MTNSANVSKSRGPFPKKQPSKVVRVYNQLRSTDRVGIRETLWILKVGWEISLPSRVVGKPPFQLPLSAQLLEEHVSSVLEDLL
jgi:hypothetical protein